MTPQHVISQLLESDTKYPRNLDLLRKIILTTYLGRLRINGLAPDDKITLGAYLFDEERVMFDYTHLGQEQHKLFMEWLLAAHEEDKEMDYFANFFVDEYRGFTAELDLNWWGRLINWFKNRYVAYWKITDLNLSLNYQLTGITLCHGEQGSLIGFNQYAVPLAGSKYNNPQDTQNASFGNIKRVFITDRLVEQLRKINYKTLNYESLCKSPHPQAIEVINEEVRYQKMNEYRRGHQFVCVPPWHIRTWQWFISLLITPEIPQELSLEKKTTLLHRGDTVQIYQQEPGKGILVIEKKPELTNLVFCGGGGKIFAHIGVWQALCEAKIRPLRFAGSSGGAIMALLCYLGYTPEEISELFKHYKQEHLVFYNISRSGLSDSHAVKTALDYAIALKLKQIVERYNIPYPKGKITFQVLESLRQLCPDCGIGMELIVTTTHKRLRKTTYFSLSQTPHQEVSEVVKTSASFPVVYKGTFIDGEEHIDGGVLSNFPTEAFSEEHSTLLESEYGINLQVLAIQFDNGTERTAVDTIEKVYRENFFLNWIYGWLTGVADPASAWKMDRMKLRKHSSQSIVIDVGNLASSSFTPNEVIRERIIANGREATQHYLQARYSDKEDARHQSQELMYSTFDSLSDLLAYCCHRGSHYWFEVVEQLIEQSSAEDRPKLVQKAKELKQLYFRAATGSPKTKGDINSITFFGNDLVQEPVSIQEEHHLILLAIYPIFLKISTDWVVSSGDKKILEKARHSLSLPTPFRCLEYLNQLKDPKHIILQLFINLIKELRDNPHETLFAVFQDLKQLLYRDIELLEPKWYGTWDLTWLQSLRVLKLLVKDQQDDAAQLLVFLARREEPMGVLKEGSYCDEFSVQEPEECLTLTI